MTERADRDAHALARVSPRSDPRQDRSRHRHKALLDAAEAILGEVGADGLRMREVARRADLPISSVYHYFPTAAALIRAVVERLFDDLRAILIVGLEQAASAPGRDEQPLIAIIDAAADFMESRPTLPALWGAMRGAPELRALDVADTEANAALLAPVLSALLPKAAPADVQALAAIVIESASTVLLLACESPPAKRVLIRQMLKEFVAAAVVGLMAKYR